jgi:hypothetical protein
MYCKMFFRLLLALVFIISVSISSGCSQGEEKNRKSEAVKNYQEKKREEFREQLKAQIRKKQEALARKGAPGEKEITKEQIASAEACMNKFQNCTETCQDKKCENICLKVLAVCEKNLPVEMQTLKRN